MCCCSYVLMCAYWLSNGIDGGRLNDEWIDNVRRPMPNIYREKLHQPYWLFPPIRGLLHLCVSGQSKTSTAVIAVRIFMLCIYLGCLVIVCMFRLSPHLAYRGDFIFAKRTHLVYYTMRRSYSPSSFERTVFCVPQTHITHVFLRLEIEMRLADRACGHIEDAILSIHWAEEEHWRKGRRDGDVKGVHDDFCKAQRNINSIDSPACGFESRNGHQCERRSDNQFAQPHSAIGLYAVKWSLLLLHLLAAKNLSQTSRGRVSCICSAAFWLRDATRLNDCSVECFSCWFLHR